MIRKRDDASVLPSDQHTLTEGWVSLVSIYLKFTRNNRYPTKIDAYRRRAELSLPPMTA